MPKYYTSEMESALLIIALGLVLTAFAPVAPSSPVRTTLRTRLARQLHLWDRYLDDLHGGGLWHS